MFHPTIGLCPTYIISVERPPLSWVVYPLRRNYSGSLTAISTSIHAKRTHNWVYQESRVIGKEIVKPVISTIKLQEYLFEFK